VQSHYDDNALKAEKRYVNLDQHYDEKMRRSLGMARSDGCIERKEDDDVFYL